MLVMQIAFAQNPQSKDFALAGTSITRSNILEQKSMRDFLFATGWNNSTGLRKIQQIINGNWGEISSACKAIVELTMKPQATRTGWGANQFFFLGGEKYENNMTSSVYPTSPRLIAHIIATSFILDKYLGLGEQTNISWDIMAGLVFKESKGCESAEAGSTSAKGLIQPVDSLYLALMQRPYTITTIKNKMGEGGLENIYTFEGKTIGRKNEGHAMAMLPLILFEKIGIANNLHDKKIPKGGKKMNSGQISHLLESYYHTSEKGYGNDILQIAGVLRKFSSLHNNASSLIAHETVDINMFLSQNHVAIRENPNEENRIASGGKEEKNAKTLGLIPVLARGEKNEAGKLSSKELRAIDFAIA
ncbi:MAG: hypothetical protein V1822_02295, partial [Candidatus Micrarchaeota archaeon]